VCTADGKGVPIRGGAEAERGAEAPTTGGMRPGSKKMALIGAVYTVDPHVRTPDEVLEALFRESPASDAPLSTPTRANPKPGISSTGWRGRRHSAIPQAKNP
jgi:hypothetical protein